MSVADPKARRTNVSDLVAAYALRLHAAAGDGHHIVSPLGAWLLVALAAPLTSGDTREEVEHALGCDVETARRAAAELLADPHPALALAFAAWHKGDIGAGLDAWCRALPRCATSGPMPTQVQANAWASKQTKGQLESMPVEINDEFRLLLVTAVATRVSWPHAFQLVPATELSGTWSSRVNCVMRRHAGDPVRVVARTAEAGLVGVSHECGERRLDVVSVIAAPGIGPARVIAAAYEVAALIAELPSTAAFVPAFDLPLIGHAWVVRERVFESYFGPDRTERSEVTIPAWTASTELPGLIAAPGTGFGAIGKATLRQIPPGPRGDYVRAAQAATARFDTNGFSAAALTAFPAVGASAGGDWRQKVERTVKVYFDRPFAVVAATGDGRSGRSELGRFRGLPAFGAWVTEPMEPSEPNEFDWQGQRRPNRWP